MRIPPGLLLSFMGGAKVGEKIGILENILPKVDLVLIGGGMAATFLKSRGCDVGISAVEPDKIELVGTILQKAGALGVRVLLPEDVVVAEKLEPGATSRVVRAEQIPADYRIADIGPLTISAFTNELEKCRTVAWNGPMGVFEIPQFSDRDNIHCHGPCQPQCHNGNRGRVHGRGGDPARACRENDPCLHRRGCLPPVPLRKNPARDSGSGRQIVKCAIFCSVEILEEICMNALLGTPGKPLPPHACGIPRFEIVLYYLYHVRTPTQVIRRHRIRPRPLGGRAGVRGETYLKKRISTEHNFPLFYRIAIVHTGIITEIPPRSPFL